MKKKVLAFILSLVLALPAGVHASGPTAISTGTVSFRGYTIEGGDKVEMFDPKGKGELPDIPGLTVPDPDNPDAPYTRPTPEQERRLRELDSMNLVFGNNLVISNADASYESANQTGVIVRSSVNWVVTVAIDGFMHESGTETLRGFTLILDPEEKEGVPISSGAVIRPQKVKISAANGAIGDAQEIAAGNAGIMGCNYNGILTVPANSAQVGNATATLWWTIQAVA